MLAPGQLVSPCHCNEITRAKFECLQTGDVVAMDDTRDCPVCFEAYTKSGKRVPRILPCFYTVCEQCVVKLIKITPDGNALWCPQCRKQHDARNGLHSFPQNKYILTVLQERAEKERSKQGKGRVEFEKCKEHEFKELSLFCRSESCNAAICELCLLGHHVEDHKEKVKELEQKLEELKEDFTTRKKKLETSKEQLEKTFYDQIADLRDMKENATKKIKEIIAKTETMWHKKRCCMTTEMKLVNRCLEYVMQTLEQDQEWRKVGKDMDIWKALARNTSYKTCKPWTYSTLDPKEFHTLLTTKMGSFRTRKGEIPHCTMSLLRAEHPVVVTWPGVRLCLPPPWMTDLPSVVYMSEAPVVML